MKQSQMLIYDIYWLLQLYYDPNLLQSFLGKDTFICVSDKTNHAATDEWCQNNYEHTRQCRGSGCQRKSYDSKGEKM